MLISSVALYLLVRKSQQLKTETVFNNFAMFAIPTFIFLVMNVFQSNSLFIPWHWIGVFALAGFFLSYLGNVFSLNSIRLAPNPGYSLILSKSYVIFTTLTAVLIFDSALSAKEIMAILLIIIFSAVIMVDKNKQKEVRASKTWVLYAFGAFFAWGGLALASKYFIGQGIEILVFLFYIFLFVSLFTIIEMKIRKKQFLYNSSQLKILILIGVSAMLFNLFMQIGYKFAPNPGYINAMNAASISLVTLCAAYFYKDDLNRKKLTGVIGVTIGLLLLLL
ncbi:EamA family transporter [Candidatus Beckwithbacteria bacterium]|nr:EamA family transporter [Candidatus Beckwithbacteria bacterium]